MLTFEPISHTYAYKGVPVPSVTTIVKPLMDGAFDFVKEEVLNAKRDLGVALHLATELYDKNDLDESSVDPAIAGYLDAYKRFRDETGFEPQVIEAQVYHPIHRYAGTLDRIGVYHKLGGERGQIDLKTVAQMHPAIAVQTAAYDAAFKAGQYPPITEQITRRGLQLKPDGTYRLTEPYTGASDFNTFLALLSIHNWKAKNVH